MKKQVKWIFRKEDEGRMEQETKWLEKENDARDVSKGHPGEDGSKNIRSALFSGGVKVYGFQKVHRYQILQ